MNVIETAGLGRQYGKFWALRDCTMAIPAGRIVALVGPNGAGKTTLLHLTVGLARATTGSVTVLGGVPPGSLEALERIAFVAQDVPLYRNLSVAEMLELASNMNRRFDWPRAQGRSLSSVSSLAVRSAGCPAASVLSSRSLLPSAATLTCLSWMNRYPAWIRSPGTTSWPP